MGGLFKEWFCSRRQPFEILIVGNDWQIDLCVVGAHARNPFSISQPSNVMLPCSQACLESSVALVGMGVQDCAAAADLHNFQVYACLCACASFAPHNFGLIIHFD